MEPNLREDVAAIQHEIWSHWMKYFISVSKINENGSITVPANYIERWKRQMQTDYFDLSEKEKNSDREQADKVLAIFNK